MRREYIEFKKWLLDIFIIPFLLVIAASLKLIDLGYSDYQGDEIKALFLPRQGESFLEFLFDQRKGPFQFVVTFLIKIFDSQYLHHFYVRLPFALAGILSVYFFYKLLTLYFESKPAFYAAFFFATNGFFTAFSRMVQYQSFVYLFAILTLYFFSLALKETKWDVKGLYIGFIFWALAVLSHYDGIFIAPLALYILFKWLKRNLSYQENKTKIKHVFFAGLLSAILVSAFYVPFMISLSEATKTYWLNRISHGEGKISSSRYLFQVYNPIYVIHAYDFLFGLGLLGLFNLAKLKKYFYESNGIFNKVKSLSKNFFDYLNIEMFFMFLWFLFPLMFMEIVINIPGTHIAAYLLPATIFIAYGITILEKTINKIHGKIGSYINFIGLLIAFLFIYLQTYAVFVDHKTEYPWKNERFFIWEFNEPSAVFHLSMFGFPYYRHWDEISAFLKDDLTKTKTAVGFYSSNERESITRYHIPLKKSSNNAGYYVYISDPQSFTNKVLNEKPNYWVSRYDPVKVYYNDRNVVAKIYKMPAESLADLKTLGY